MRERDELRWHIEGLETSVEVRKTWTRVGWRRNGWSVVGYFASMSSGKGSGVDMKIVAQSVSWLG